MNSPPTKRQSFPTEVAIAQLESAILRGPEIPARPLDELTRLGPVQSASLDQSLNNVVLDSIPSLAQLLAIVYLAYGLMLVAIPSGGPGLLGCLVAFVTSSLFVALSIACRRRVIAPSAVHAFATGLVALILANTLVDLTVTERAEHTLYLLALVMGVGFFFLSTIWTAISLSLVLVGWVAVALIFGAPIKWLYYGVPLLAMSVVSGLVHEHRLRLFRKLEGLRLLEQSWREQLAETLNLARNEITRRKRMEREMRDHEARLRLVINTAPIALVVVDRDGLVTFADGRGFDSFGIFPGDLVGRVAWHLRAAQPLVDPLRRALAGESYTATIRERDRYWELRSTPLTETDRVSVGALVVGIDVTDRMAANDALRRSQERLRLFVEHTPAAIAMLDLDYRIVLSSRRWAEEMHLVNREIIGRPFFAFFPTLEKEWRPRFARAIAGKPDEWDQEHRFSADYGPQAFHWETYPWYDDKGRHGGLIVFGENITQRKRVEAELHAAVEAAEAANQAKSDFLANMSHEVRTPMSAVLGHTEMLLDPNLSFADHSAAIHAIKRSGEHLLQIINDILDLSKIEAGKLDIELIEWSPWQVLADVISTFEVRAVEKSISLFAAPTGPIPRVALLDPTRVRQVLVNLLSNAIKFTEKGKVEVRMGIESSRPERTKADQQAGTSARREVMLRVEVEDQGLGMTAEQINRLFQPFNQGDSSMTRRYGGTGLGLSICRRLAEAMGGEIRVESEISRGSLFIFRMPVTLPDNGDLVSPEELCGHVPREILPPARPHVVHPSTKLLLAEDSPDNQRVLLYFLNQAGYAVDVAENGRLAVEKAFADDYSLILMDMQMPELDGYSATSFLRRQGFVKPIIALTAHAMRGDAEKCLRAGCTDYLAKPVDRQTLLESIGRHLVAAQPRTPTGGDSLARKMEFDPVALEHADAADHQDFRSMVDDYARSLPTSVKNFRDCLETADYRRLESLVHQTRSAAVMYGFARLGRVAGQLETAVRTGEDLSILSVLVDEFERHAGQAQADPASSAS